MSEQSEEPERSGAEHPDDIDARFREIIATWDVASAWSWDEPPPPSAKVSGVNPAPDGIPPFRADPPASPISAEGAARPGESAAGDPIEAGWRAHEPVEAEDHFEPPDPSLPPAHDATFWLAIGGMIGGPLLIVWATVVSANPDPGWWVLAGIVATVVGFGLVVMRGSTERDLDDDGSRV